MSQTHTISDLNQVHHVWIFSRNTRVSTEAVSTTTYKQRILSWKLSYEKYKNVWGCFRGLRAIHKTTRSHIYIYIVALLQPARDSSLVKARRENQKRYQSLPSFPDTFWHVVSQRVPIVWYDMGQGLNGCLSPLNGNNHINITYSAAKVCYLVHEPSPFLSSSCIPGNI